MLFGAQLQPRAQSRQFISRQLWSNWEKLKQMCFFLNSRFLWWLVCLNSTSKSRGCHARGAGMKLALTGKAELLPNVRTLIFPTQLCYSILSASNWWRDMGARQTNYPHGFMNPNYHRSLSAAAATEINCELILAGARIWADVRAMREKLRGRCTHAHQANEQRPELSTQARTDSAIIIAAAQDKPKLLVSNRVMLKPGIKFYDK